MSVFYPEMNRLVDQWKEQFDTYDGIALSFSENASGQLCFNDQVLCAADMELESATFDRSAIVYRFNDNRQIIVSINWPEDKPPYLRSVVFGYVHDAPREIGV